ncbi:sodium:solute symporter [Rubellicoccus peritrichatus]|uniref:Sodium:solute symporter n=1 Tax=Rubellicoccus peritrichatus TaxID=3080537 RepID=A0AAQ3L7A9_9BACT|nr:sodium:solute symporter [Puniceicoccus sp. CR14]WOO40316.1 sodium:solute symporter [Puniceicoccus sp. CR14]
MRISKIYIIKWLLLLLFSAYVALQADLMAKAESMHRLQLRSDMPEKFSFESESIPFFAWDDRPSAYENDTLIDFFQKDNDFYVLLKSHDALDQYQLCRIDKKGDWAELSSPPFGTCQLADLGMVGVVALIMDDDGGLQLGSYHTVTDRWTSLPLETDRTFKLPVLQSHDGALFLFDRSEPDQLAEAIYEIELASTTVRFSWLDYTAIIIYMIVLISIGLVTSKKSSTSSGFFLGGRKIPFWAVGFSLYATGTSAISFMAIPAKTFATDWTYIWMSVFGIVGFGLLAVYIVPLIRRLLLTSTYEYLEMRFNVAVRLLGGLICIVSQVGGRMSVVLFLPALALSTVTGFNIYACIIVMGGVSIVYTVMGGISAVIWTDVLQVVVLLGGALVSLVAIIMEVPGGLEGVIQTSSQAGKFSTGSFSWSYVVPGFWILLLSQAADLLTWPRDQVMMQRVFATPSAKEAGKSIWTLNLIVIPGNLLFFFLGTALFAYYQSHPVAANPSLDLDATFPHFIVSELPAGVAGLVIAALFAASMSTLDSAMNSVATVVVVDFVARVRKNMSDAARLSVAHWVTIIVGVIGTSVALLLATFDLPSLWDIFIKLMALLGGGFGGVFTLGLLTRRANSIGALTGAVASLIITLWFDAATDANGFAVAAMATFSCIAVGYLVSLLTPASTQSLKGLTIYDR